MQKLAGIVSAVGCPSWGVTVKNLRVAEDNPANTTEAVDSNLVVSDAG